MQIRTNPQRNCCQHSNQLTGSNFHSSPRVLQQQKNQLPTFHNSVPPQLASTGHWTKFFGRLPPQTKEETEQIFASNWRTGSLFILQDPTVFQNAVVKIDAGAQRQPLAKVLFEQTTKWAGLGSRVWLLLLLLLLAQFPSMMLSKVPGT